MENRRKTKVPNGMDPAFINDLSTDVIIGIICKWYNIIPQDMPGNGHKRPYADARHMIVYFLSLKDELSLKAIGILTGNRSHASVINSRNNIENWMETNSAFARDIESLFEILRLKL